MQYPLVFWKVVAVSTRDTNGRRSLRTYGFRLSQKDVVDRFGVEFAPGEYARYQVALSAISDEAGVIFDDVLLRADTHADAYVTLGLAATASRRMSRRFGPEGRHSRGGCFGGAEAQQIVYGALRVRGGGEDRSFIVLQRGRLRRPRL